GMTGQLRLLGADAPPEKHTPPIFTPDGDFSSPSGGARPLPRHRGSDLSSFPSRPSQQLRYRDPRRFGRLLLGTQESLLASKKMPRLGPEPIDLDFAAEELYRTPPKRRP